MTSTLNKKCTWYSCDDTAKYQELGSDDAFCDEHTRANLFLKRFFKCCKEMNEAYSAILAQPETNP